MKTMSEPLNCWYCNKIIEGDHSFNGTLHETCRNQYNRDLQTEQSALQQLNTILQTEFDILTFSPVELDIVLANYVIVNSVTKLVSDIVIDGGQFEEDGLDKITGSERILDVVAMFSHVKTVLLQFFDNLGKLSTDLSHLDKLQSIQFNNAYFTCTDQMTFPDNLKHFDYSYDSDYPFPCNLIEILPGHLEQLAIQNPFLDHIPFGINGLPHLKMVKINARIKKIPEHFFLLPNVQILDLSSNEIENIPESWGQLQALQELKLSANKISSIPAIKTLPNVTSVDLANNRITDISSLVYLSSLIKLDISSNRITDITTLGTLKHLKTLFINNNELTCIPDELHNITTLKNLHASGNHLTTIPFFTNVKLEALTISFDFNSPVLETISNYESLKYLKITNMTPYEIPQSFKELKNLEYLIVYIGEKFIPQFIKELPNIRNIEAWTMRDNTRMFMTPIVPDCILSYSKYMEELHEGTSIFFT